MNSSINPGAILAAMYCSLYGLEITRSEIMMCNRLVKVFGRTTVFFSILDMFGSYPAVQQNVRPLLYAICKRRFETAHVNSIVSSRENLDNYVSNKMKEIEKVKKQKITIPALKEREKDV